MAEKYRETQNQVQAVNDQLVGMYKKDFITFPGMPRLAMGAAEERKRFLGATAQNYMKIRAEEPGLDKRAALEKAIQQALKQGDFLLIQKVQLQDAPGMLWGSKPISEKIKELP